MSECIDENYLFEMITNINSGLDLIESNAWVSFHFLETKIEKNLLLDFHVFLGSIPTLTCTTLSC